MQPRQRNPAIDIKSGPDPTELALQHVTLLTWVCAFRFGADASFLRVQPLVECIGFPASALHGALLPARVRRQRVRGDLIIDSCQRSMRRCNTPESEWFLRMSARPGGKDSAPAALNRIQAAAHDMKKALIQNFRV
jgi:hypothetical protein